MGIYTKTGDKGETSLVGHVRVSKGCVRLECYGTTDELNSHVGLLITYCSDAADLQFLAGVQSKLFVVGGYLATDNSQTEIREGNIVTEEMVQEIEDEIDRLQKRVPPMKMFVVPGGSRGAAYAHVCRTICRRAERNIVRLMESGAVVDDNVLALINRLSDYFFVLARKLNVDNGVEEKIWKRITETAQSPIIGIFEP